LRGEEMLLIEYAGTAKSLENILDPKEPHFTCHDLREDKGKSVVRSNV
jgi:hypothetical protein